MNGLEPIARKPRWWIVGIAVGLVAVAAIGTWGFVYLGVYNIGADAPHTRLVYWLLGTVRDRSIVAHATGIIVPADLGDTKRIAAGAGLYAEMCSTCHLAPGMEKTEIAQGLYPAAPELAQGTDLTPSEEFWVIKHGIKATGMAAWGKTHDDTLIWDMVAFLQKLPTLSADQYKTIVKSAPEDHDEMMKMQDADHGQ